jgi:seryl-tRNA synthetase
LNAQGVTTNSNKLALQNAINNLNKNLKDEQTFKNNEQQCRQDLHEIDKEFDELAEMNSEIMHSIKNLALVDGPTNSALSNNLMDEKRTILKQRSQILEGQEDPESYIPLGTWYAFNKYYSSNVQDLKFWTKHDREAYFDAINKIYNKYIS